MRGRRRRSWASAMGNRMCGGSGRRPVEERLTRPQRLQRQPSHVDYKKLRKLILSRKLAPCFDALEVEDPRLQWDLEECPICFFYYPSLNRSTCCAKGICTECFLQMTPWDATRPPQCPFCKTPCYAVEYHGARTEEEKGLELAEEQRVIEAKIRMLSESEKVEQVMSMDHARALEVGSPVPDLDRQLSGLEDGGRMADVGFSLRREGFLADCSSVPSTCCRQEESPLDLEEILMMDAIWESLQVQASKDVPLHEWVADQTSGSSNCVGLETGANQLSNSGALFASVGSRSRTGLTADSSKNSIMSDATNVGCSRSVDLHSTLNAYVECEDCASDGAGQSSSSISSLIFTEQPLMLATGSKA